MPRARIIGDAVVWIGHTGDRWEDIAGKMWILDEGKRAPIWQIEGEGWTTSIMTRFCGLTCEVDVTSYDEDPLPVVAPRSDEVAVDVHYPEAGKVPSIGSTGDVDTLIVMQPGSWKTSFGVPHCEWSSAVARRLAPGISP